MGQDTALVAAVRLLWRTVLTRHLRGHGHRFRVQNEDDAAMLRLHQFYHDQTSAPNHTHYRDRQQRLQWPQFMDLTLAIPFVRTWLDEHEREYERERGRR